MEYEKHILSIQKKGEKVKKRETEKIVNLK